MKNKSFLSVVLFLSLLFVPLSSWARNENYLRFINTSAASADFYINYYSSNSWGTTNHEYITGTKLKNGDAWASLLFKQNISVNAGDSIMIRVKDGKTLTQLNTSSAYCYFNLTSGSWEVKGDLLTLIAVNEPVDRAIPAGFKTHTFLYLFKGSTKLVSAEGLLFPDKLNVSCCDQMFNGCTSLTTAPKDMSNIVEIPDYGLNKLFTGCAKLTTVPRMPKAETVGKYGMNYMFQNCTLLTVAPDTLYATTLENYAYYGMFFGCPKITKSPVMRAMSMPVASSSAMGAMGLMFRYAAGGGALNSVEVRMKSWFNSGTNYYTTYLWLGGCATNGTFICSSSLPTVKGDNKIPTNWNVLYYPVISFDVATNGGQWKDGTTSTISGDWYGDGEFPTPTKDGQAFNGWYTAASGGTMIEASSPEVARANPANTLTLYAQFGSSRSYKFYPNGGTWADESSDEYKEYGEELKSGSYPSIARAGYRFIEWNTASDGTGDAAPASPAYLPNSDQDYYAIWAPIFTFDVATNGGTWDGSDNTNKDKTKAELMEEEIGSAQKVDYTFTGWQDQNGTPYPGASSLGETPTTYYAQFLPNLTFDPAGGKWSDESTSAKVITTAIDESPSRNGYHFDGWDNDYDPAQLPSTPTIFTAQWSAYDYTFDVATNGGTWDGLDDASRTIQQPAISELPVPEKLGFIFDGWNTQIDGSGIMMDLDNLPLANTTYYAQFVKVSFFTMTAEVDNVTISSQRSGSPSNLPALQYSVDGGVHWTLFEIRSTSIMLASAGDAVWFRGVNPQGLNPEASLSISGGTPQGDYWYFTSSAAVSLSGDIMTLVYGSHPLDEIPADKCFADIFYRMKIKDASDLVLPSTTRKASYLGMFVGSTLQSAPLLPATEVADYAYFGMFYNCSTMVNTPDELPATTIGNSAYYSMFWECKKMQTAPVIRALSYGTDAMGIMFRNCSTLNSISVRFKSWPAPLQTNLWASSVASSGTFTCPSALPKTTGTSNIPTLWVVNYIPELTFNVVANGGRWTSGTDNLVLDTEQPLTELPVAYTDNVNQTFRGWNTVADGSGTWLTLDNQPVISTTAQRITYYAIYATDYTFDVATNNGTWDGAATENRVFNGVELKIEGAPAAVHVLGATQYAHVGWNTSASATTNSLDVDNLPAASTSFYAIFLPCYTFKLNGGIWSDGTLEDKIFTTFTSNPVATRNGYTFTRWNTMEDGTGEDFDWQSPTGTPTTYYAIWQDINYTFNLTAFPGTTWDGSDTQDRIYTGAQLLDMSAAMPVAENGDLQFVGWTTSPTGASNEFDKNYLPATATTFYPVFKNYLCITALTDGVNIGTYFYGSISADNIKAQYLRKEEDGGTGKWTQIYFNSRDKFVTLSEGQKVYIRGWNKSGINTLNYTGNSYVKFCISKAAELSGNIMTLIDSINPPTTIPNEYCFAGLFRHNTGTVNEYSNIVKADKLQMPASAVPQGAYESLFRACPLLTSAPDLSAARSVSMSSYKEMFLGCTSLLAMPAMPNVEDVAEGAYKSMFRGCTSLTTTQELTARSLAREAYYEMFRNCTSLVNAPVIHAMSWTGSGAMAYMFMGCTALRRMEVKFRTWDAGETDATYTTYLWMDGTTTNPEDNAVFVCPGTLADCSRDASHIQLNWNLVVPEIVITHDCTTSGLSEMADVRILKGATLTLADNYRAKNITIHAGAKLTIPADCVLSCDSIFMRGGEVVDDTYYYIYPEMVVNGNITGHDGEVTPIFYDYLINNAQNYTLCLPYDVECKEVTYAETGTPARFVVKYYDGAERVNGTEGETWKNLWYKWNPLDPETPSTILHAGQGYTVFGTPYTPLGQTYSYFRFPMHPDLRTLPEQPKTLNVFGYGCAGGKPIKPNNGANVGWNLVGNPYMAGFGNSWVSLLLNETKQLSYVILPNDEGTNYTTELLGDADMPAFKNFFIQVFEDAELDFNLSTRRQNAPARYAAAQEIERSFVGVSLTSDGGMTDRVGVAISDEYSEEYDAYADLTKWNNRDLNLCAEVGNNSLAMAAVSTSMAANSVPLRVAASEGGTFTFALHQPWCSNLDLFTHIYLMDVEEGAQVDLLSETYTYTAAAGSEENRFYLMAVPRYTPTDLESATMMKTGVRKIMSNGTLFIIVGDKVFDVHGRVVNLR